MTDFTSFGLSDPLLKAINDLGFADATPIQKKAIPNLIHNNLDFIGLAHTGTGKTAAFAIPLIENIEIDFRFTQAVIIAPTRELVKQIEQEILILAKYVKGIKCLAVYGGTSVSEQIRDLRKPPHILIATPGRLLDLINRRVVHLKDVKFIVLDEADEMLNMGFKEDIDSILSSVKEEHNTWLFSATFPKEIRRISKEYMNDPLEFAVDSIKETNADIQHEYCMVKGAKKIDFLKRILDANSEIRGIVFCRTKRGTQSLSDELVTNGYKVDALHGDMSQAQRDRVMKRFRNYQVKVLIATDVAARGIDVKDLSHIIHYDIPDDLSYYTHRSGRTGRAGKKGTSIVFVPPSQHRRIKNLEKMLTIQFKDANIPSDKDIVKFRMTNWATGIAEMKELSNVDSDIQAEVYKILGNFTKEDLMEKILTNELRNLNYEEIIRRKETEKTERPSRSERSERSGRSSERSARSGRSSERPDRSGRSSDRSERSGRLSERSERSGRSESRSNNRKEDRKSKSKGRNKKVDTADAKGNINFFINVGFIDGIGKRDLLEYLAEQTKLDINMFQNIEMSKRHTFFDAPQKFEGKIISIFKDVRIADRQLRVNRNQN